MSKIRIFILFVSLFILGGCANSKPSNYYQVLISDHNLSTVAVGDSTNLHLEIVNTPESIFQGLSGRDEIGADGMLFIFPKPLKPAFWMKEMKFDLDLVWIRENRIIEITADVPAPNPETSLTELPRYSPQKSVDMVLEVPAGSVSALGFKIGDLVKIR